MRRFENNGDTCRTLRKTMAEIHPPPLGLPQWGADWQLRRDDPASSQSSPRRARLGRWRGVRHSRSSFQSALRRDKPGGGSRVSWALRNVPVTTILLSLALSGCSGSSLVEVTGEVMLDDKPVEQGIISFWPQDGAGPTAQAVIQQGKYKAEVAPGAKKVGVEAVVESGKAYPSGPSGPAVPIHKPVSPPDYRDARKTSLRCEVSSASNIHNFNLKSL